MTHILMPGWSHKFISEDNEQRHGCNETKVLVITAGVKSNFEATAVFAYG